MNQLIRLFDVASDWFAGLAFVIIMGLLQWALVQGLGSKLKYTFDSVKSAVEQPVTPPKK